MNFGAAGVGVRLRMRIDATMHMICKAQLDCPNAEASSPASQFYSSRTGTVDPHETHDQIGLNAMTPPRVTLDQTAYQSRVRCFSEPLETWVSMMPSVA